MKLDELAAELAERTPTRRGRRQSERVAAGEVKGPYLQRGYPKQVHEGQCGTCGRFGITHETHEAASGPRTVALPHSAPCGLPCARHIPATFLYEREGRTYHAQGCARCKEQGR